VIATITGNRQDGTTPRSAALVLTHDERNRERAARQLDHDTGGWTVTVRCLHEDRGQAAIEVDDTLADTDPGLVLFIGSAVAADPLAAGGVIVADRVSVLEQRRRFGSRPATRRAGSDLISQVGRTLRRDRWRRRADADRYEGGLTFGKVAIGSERHDAAGDWHDAFPDAAALDPTGWDFVFGYYDIEELPALAVYGLVADDADEADRGEASARAAAVAAELLAGVTPAGLRADPLDVAADEGEREHLRGDAEILPHESTQSIVQRPFTASRAPQGAGVPRTAKPQMTPAYVNAYIDSDGVPPADLHLIVRLNEDSLEFTLNSDRPDLPYNMQPVGEKSLGAALGGGPKEYRDNIKAQVLKIARRPDPSDAKALRDLGAKLYNDLFPDALKAEYAEFREKDVRTLQITSDEPWIPWELVRPHGRDFLDDTYLCVRYAMTRWLAGGNPKQLFNINAIASLEAGAVAGEALLPTAREECDFIADLAAKRQVENLSPGCASYQVVESLLSQREREISLWHVAAHGKLGDTEPDESVVMFEDRQWKATDLAGESGYAIQRDRPLVFFNACLVGQQDFSLARLAGWPAAWVQQNECGGFLAPQWSVSSRLASVFSKAFYEAVTGEADGTPKTLGEAARLARLAVHEADGIDPAWLAYVVYGHPNARVHFGARTATVA
jgi:hypothetical protein